MSVDKALTLSKKYLATLEPMARKWKMKLTIPLARRYLAAWKRQSSSLLKKKFLSGWIDISDFALTKSVDLNYPMSTLYVSPWSRENKLNGWNILKANYVNPLVRDAHYSERQVKPFSLQIKRLEVDLKLNRRFLILHPGH